MKKDPLEDLFEREKPPVVGMMLLLWGVGLLIFSLGFLVGQKFQ